MSKKHIFSRSFTYRPMLNARKSLAWSMLLSLMGGGPGLAENINPLPNMNQLSQFGGAGRGQSQNTPVVSAGAPSASRGTVFDLGSNATNVLLNSGLFKGQDSVVINAGGVEKTLFPGQIVTAGEFVAARQVLSGGAQSINLSQLGVALSGTLSLNQIMNQKASQVVIPANVSASTSSRVPYIGTELTNHGSIYVAPNSVAGKTAVLGAREISNYGGLITSELSGTAFSSLSKAGSVDLVLQALNNITNTGTISSSGSLTLTTANGGISNIVSPSGQQGVISATNNVNLLPGNGQLVNAGLVQALNGNINIATPNPNTNLNILGTAGNFDASLGSINIRDGKYSGHANIDILGGNFYSKTVNIFAGNGGITGSVDDVTGCLHTNGKAAHFWANTPVLHLGDGVIDGDPLFVNIGGDILISGVLDVTASGEPLALVARDNIHGDDTAQLKNNGGDIILIAGADFTYAGGTSFPTPADAGVSFTDISVPSANGGDIKFDSKVGLFPVNPVIDSSSKTGNGGNVIMLALENAGGTNGGHIAFPTNTNSVDSSSLTGKAGNILVLANSTDNLLQVISTGHLLAGGQTGGNIGLYAESPSANPVSIDMKGVVTGNITPSGVGPATAKIQTRNIVTAGAGGAGAFSGPAANGGSAGNIDIRGGSILINGAVLAYGGGGGGGGNDSAMGVVNNGGNGGNGGNVSITAVSDIDVYLDISTSGGGGGGAGYDLVNASVPGKGGSPGSITISSSSGNISVQEYVLAAPGGDGGASNTLFAGGIGTGGGGSFGGGGGGGAGKFTGLGGGGGGGAGYTNLTEPFNNLAALPPYFLASAGGGAGGLSFNNFGGDGGGYFGAGAGGISTDPDTSSYGTAGNGNDYSGTAGYGAGGNGGGANPGLGGVYWPEKGRFPTPYTGFPTTVYGAAGGTGGGAGQNVDPSNSLLGGNVSIDGGKLDISNTSPSWVDPASQWFGSTIFANNLLLLSRDFGSGAGINLTTGILYIAATGNVTMVSAGSIFSNDAKVVVPGHDTYVLAGVDISGPIGGPYNVDLGTGNGGSIGTFSFDTSSSTLDAGNITVVSRDGTTAGGIDIRAAASSPLNGGSVFTMTDGGTLEAHVRTTAGVQSGNIEVYGQTPEGILSVDATAKVSGTVLRTGALASNFLDIDGLISAGAGGTGSLGKNGGNGGNGGDITIETAGTITAFNWLAFGGGGAGGGSDLSSAGNGGNGGDGGNISVKANDLNLSGDPFILISAANSSGGGGGGGAGNPSSFGAGGIGGKAGSITIDVSNKFVYGARLLAADGGDGGDGSIKGGGGGGGSFGGGGGGGGSLLVGPDIANAGGGGGGFVSNSFVTYAASGGGGGAGDSVTSVAGGGGGGGSLDGGGLGNRLATGAGGATLGGGNSGNPGGISNGGDGAGPTPGTGGTSPVTAGSPLGTGTFGKGAVNAKDGSGPPVSTTANADISVKAATMVGSIALLVNTGTWGKDVSFDVSGSIENALTLSGAYLVGTNSVSLKAAKTGVFVSPLYYTPDLTLDFDAGDQPFSLSAIGGVPTSLKVDAPLSVITGTISGPLNLQTSNAKNFVILADDTVTVAAGAKIVSAGVVISTPGSISQQDPLTTPTIYADTLSAFSNGLVSLSTGNISGQTSIKAVSQFDDVMIHSEGPVVLQTGNAGARGDGKAFLLATTADKNGNGSITIDAGQVITADNIILQTGGAGTGDASIKQVDPLSTVTLDSAGALLSSTSTSTSPQTISLAMNSNGVTGGVTFNTPSFNVDFNSPATDDLKVLVLGGLSSLNLQHQGNLELTGPLIVTDGGLTINTAGNLKSAGFTSGSDATVTAGGTMDFGGAITVVPQLNLISGGSLKSFSSILGNGIFIDALTIDAASMFSALGKITLLTSSLTNAGPGSIDALGDITITGRPSSQLTINNGGTIVSHQGDIRVTAAEDQSILVQTGMTAGNWFLLSKGHTIYFDAPVSTVATVSDITFDGDQFLAGGPVIMTAAFDNQKIQVNDTILVQGNELVWLKTPLYSQIGSGQILGSPLVVGVPGKAGTIANSGGDVTLPSNLTFVGQDLAILASGNIISTGLSSINLSTNGSIGGSLTMVAGFNFTPATLGQVFDANTYTIGTPSTGGSISLPGVSINLSATDLLSGIGGNLIAVAHGGSVTMGSINTSATSIVGGLGGHVTIIGQNGVSVGSINTTAATMGGTLTISAADSLTTGTTVISAGRLLTGGFSPVPGTFNNNISFSGNINTGTAPVTLSTGGTGAITSPPGISITTSQLTMTAGTGGIGTQGAPIATSAATLSANSIGDVFLSSSASALSLAASSGNKFQLTSSKASSIVSIDGALSANDIVLKSTNAGSFVLNSALTALNGGPATSVAINVNGKGSITDTYQQSGLATISATALSMTSGTGTIGTAAQPIQTDASTLSATTTNTTAAEGVYINNINTSPVTINGLTSGSTKSAIVYTGQASALTISGQVSGTAVSIDNQGAVNINNKITATGDLLVNAAGNLQTNSAISGLSVALSTTSGSAGSISLGGPITSTGAVTLSADGNISTTSTIKGAAITLQNLGSSGNINVGATITGTGLVTMNAIGSLTTASSISGDGISLSTAPGSSGSVSLGGTLVSTGAIGVFSDNAISTTGSISGTDIDIQNSGVSGSTTLGGPINGSGQVTIAAKGSLTASSTISGVGIDLSTAAGTSGSITLGGTVNSGADIQISSDNSITTSGAITSVLGISLQNTGPSGSTTIGGTVSSGGFVDVDSKGTLTINSPITAAGAGFISLNAQGNININGTISGNNVIVQTLPGSNGNIALAANVSSTDNVPAPFGVTIAADGVGSITQSTGILSTSTTPIAFFSTAGAIGSVGNPIAFNAPTLLANSAGNVFLLGLAANTTVQNSSGNSFNLTSAGNITINGAPGFGLGGNNINLSTLNNGNITLANDIHGVAGTGSNALTVNISLSGTGTLTDTFQGSPTISSNNLVLSAVNGSFGTSGPGQTIVTNAQNITSNTLGDTYLTDTRTGTTTVLASTGSDYSLSASKVAVGAPLVFSGTASFSTSDFTNPAGNVVTAGAINIYGMAGSPLTVKNGGTLVATALNGNINISSAVDQNLLVGNAGGPTPGAMQVTGGGTASINLTAVGSTSASINDLIFTGNQNFFGDTNLTASTGLGQVVQVNTGVTIQGFQAVKVQSNDLILQGTLIGNPLIFNSPSGAGTIANSQGDVLLSSDLIFNGKSLAIIASGNVLVSNPSGIVIDLSNTSAAVNQGFGGTLSVVAGFNFSPATGGQVGPDGSVYAIANNPSTAGGSISLSNATIYTGTSVDGKNSGNVLAAAHAGTQNDGSINLGPIDTSNTGIGGAAGSVTVIAQGGATLASINTTGDVDGAVTISSAAPQIIGIISDQNGNFSGGGSIQPTPTTFSGNIVLSSIDAGAATVTATTGQSGNITINDDATVSAATILLTSGSSGGVEIGDDVLVQGSVVNISAGTLGIANIDGSALIDSPVLVMSTSGGDIGSEFSPINITATTLTANAGGNGNVYLFNSATTDINLVDSGLLSNGAGDIFSLTALNPGGTNTLTSGGASINAPHVFVESLNGNLNVAITPSANSIDLRALSGNITLASSSVSVVPDSSDNGGSISLNSASLSYTGSGLSPLTLSANAIGNGNGGSISFTTSGTATLTIGGGAGNITINATGGSGGSSAGNGGSAFVSTGGNLNFDPSKLNIVPLGNNGNGGSLDFTAGTVTGTSTLNLTTSSITENGVGNGNGGRVFLTAPFITYQNSGTLPLTLTANGGSNGNGGVVGYVTTNPTALIIGGGSNSLNLAASSGTAGGNGGTVVVSTGGALTVTPANISAGPLGAVGNGANITLLAGTTAINSPLFISSTLSANAKGAATGGSLVLQSNSSAPFVIAPPSPDIVITNGIRGLLTVAGSAGDGSLSLTNLSGGITSNPLIQAVGALSFTAGQGDITLAKSVGKSTTSSITMNAQGSIIEQTATTILTANTMNLTAATGNIGKTTPSLLFRTVSNNLTANSGNMVNITNSSKNLTLGSSSAGAAGFFTLASNGNITTSGAISAGTVKVTSGANSNIVIGDNITSTAGSVTLTANGKGSIFNQFASGTDRITGSAITLKSSTGSIGLIGTSPVALRVQSGSITPTTSGSVNIDNSSAAPLTIAGSLARQTFRLNTQGNLTISKAITGAKQINLSTAAGGNIAVNANLGGGGTTIITVNAGGAGNISTLSKSIVLAATQSVTLTSGTGNIGTGTATTTAVTTRTPILAANTGGTGVVNLVDTTNGTLASSSSGGSFSITGNAKLTVGNLSTTNGDINIIAKGSLLQTSTGTTITANNGALLFNNTNTAGKILIANNSTVQTLGVSGGDVQIGIGALPFAQANPANPPTNVDVVTSGGGQVFFGTNGITGPTVAPNAKVNAIGKDVIFSTGKAKATAITLGNGAVVTADPPVVDTLGASSSIPQTIHSLSSMLSPLSSSRPNSVMSSVSVSGGSSTASGVEFSSSQSTPAQLPFNFVTPQSNSAVDSAVYFNSARNGGTRSETIAPIHSTLPDLFAADGVELGNGSVPATLFAEFESGELSSPHIDKSNNQRLDANGLLKGSVEKAKLPSAAQLKQGSVLLAPSQKMTVLTPAGELSLDAGSVVLLMSHKNGVSIFDIDDAHRGAVELKTKSGTIVLAPGRHCSIGHTHNFADVNPAQMIPHRNLTSSASAEHYIIQSEFSLPVAFEKVVPISKLMSSKHPQAKKLVSHMLKTAAGLLHLTRSAGVYQQYSKQAVTALLK